MARYRLKRKTFGVVDAARDAIGGTVETAGDIVGSGLGKIAGAATGAAYAPAIGSAVSSALGGSAVGKLVGASLGNPIGGALLGWGAAKLGGKLLKKAGQGISTE